ncbi:winged helix-turn-helix transcriptional regulator [Microbulbifer rhizosphaerae]|uniref:DNA-binding HxlR family transcriptional regulator n=1 Tax=Microbulbifer rhizosphaerae TaxID=1562603 RepID=A0A7W4WC08_9GAMM|nr:helix-turn-helix domain-containing protein [Microbulbifer rhizosphaerae]MBB3060801.1 DNA-binding HxlR family transcriptional regulator [Microbulbifer rhizosphaerae]
MPNCPDTIPATMRSRCALANGLEILGDRWTLLIIRDLMFTNRREFRHFLASSEGISTNILTDRLQRLQGAGIISKRPHPDHGKKFIYELTTAGRALAPTMIEFALWALHTIEGTFLPQPLLDMMENHRDELVEKIGRGEYLLELDLR